MLLACDIGGHTGISVWLEMPAALGCLQAHGINSMTILTINAGSTSVKLALFEMDASHRLMRVRTESHASQEDPRTALEAFKGAHPSALTAIAHRVVHGGERFSGPVVLDAAAVAAIEELSALAPLHNPLALRWIKVACELWSQVPQVAAFDTSLFKDLPRVAAEYALPPSWGTAMGVRRYGFHGSGAPGHAGELVPAVPGT